MPLVLLHGGEAVVDRLDKARVDLEDALQAARATQGLERMEQTKYAVLERSGGISIIAQTGGMIRAYRARSRSVSLSREGSRRWSRT